ncbi:MAG TPA: isoprenylcysteine carboxylmethyltransferase family protein [Burkholderiales bacterium]|nr:isoprenylcysteine carboxylmethyltransferase family protein [Burkholderiales bacterium]
MNRQWPVLFLPDAIGRALGWLLILVGFALLGWAVLAMRRARTSINPYTPTSAIAVTGPYRYSRNPIYLADIAIYVGASVAAGMPWPLAFLPPVLWVMNKGVIEREERYLERRFGETYLRYKATVPRWLRLGP